MATGAVDNSNKLELSPLGASALLGATSGLAVSSSPVERLAFEYFTRKGSPYRPYANTPIAVGLRNGSGEAMMTDRWQELLKKHGINTTYAPTFIGWDNPGYDTTVGSLLKNKEGRRGVDALKASGNWGKTVHVQSGVEVSGLEDALKRFTPEELKKFEKLLNQGKYNELSPGILRDFALLDKKLVLNPDRLGPSREPEYIAELARKGKAKTFFNAFRGFTAPSWNAAADLTHLENWNNSNNYSGMFNLGRSSEFQANYNAKTKHFIPGTKVYDNWMNGNPVTARLSHALDRATVIDKIRSVGDKNIKLDGKKIIFMDSGSVGPNNSQKIRDLVDAVKGRNDVHILFQYGKPDQYAKDLIGPRGVLTGLMNNNPGLITAVERLQPQEMARMINGSDLHITYGGSSSAGEAGSHLTPTVFTRDATLNDKNLQFVRRNRNSFGGTKIKKLDSIHTAIAHELAELKRQVGNAPISDAQLDDLLFRIGRDKMVQSTYAKRIAQRMLKDPTYAEKIKARNSRIINDMLSDSVQNARYSSDNINSARKYIDKVRASDKHLVDSTKSVLTNLIQKDDTQRVKRLGADIKALLAGNKSKKLRLATLRRLASLRGLSNMNLAIGGLLTNNPIGRRAALPAIALSSLGGYGYKKYKDLKK